MLKTINRIRRASVWNVIFNKRFYWVLGILGVIALLKIFIVFQFDLHSEEAQYWIWSKRLQLSYYSKPPLIAYLNWFSTSVFGDNVFGIRINAVIIGLLISVVSYLLAFELFKNTDTAVFAAIVTNVFPLMLSNSIFFLTDAPLLFFWLCAMLTFWKAAETRELVWWALFGVSLGLGGLSKYSIFLIFIPLVLFSLKYYPGIFKTRNFYLSILIALIIFSPVIYWNVQQNGVGYKHLVHLAGVYDHPNSVGKILSNMLEFVIGQIAILLPFYQYRRVYLKFRQKTITKQEEYLVLPALCMFIAFFIISVIRRSGAYVNWTLFAYTGVPLLFAHLVVSEDRVKFNRRISETMGLSLLLFVLLCSPANTVLPLGSFNPLNKTMGWSQLSGKIDSLKASFAPENYYIFSPDYHITSELWFYLKGQPKTYFLNMNSRMTQFDLWPGIEQFVNTGKTGILVDLTKITPEIKGGFSSVLKEDSCTVFSQNNSVCTYYIYFLQGLKGFSKQHSSY